MHTDYADIRDRIREEPLWFDEQAVPRYCSFAPSAMANVYAQEAALVLAACQTCLRQFRLAISRPSSGAPDLATAIHCRTLRYGDPPNIGCCDTGPTQGVVELKVLEYWRRATPKEWTRETSFELSVVPAHLADNPRFAAYADSPNPLSFGAITEEPGGAQFQELVGELLIRYPAAPRETIEAALRSNWRIGAFAMWCFKVAERELP